MYNAGGSFYPYSIDQSLRFNAADSAHLTFTQGTATDISKWTVNFWLKRTEPLAASDDYDTVFGVDGPGNTAFTFFNGQIYLFVNYNTGGSQARLITNRVFRDSSAWYNFHVTFDAANGTAAQRLRLYVNGVEETSFATDERSNITSSSSSGWNVSGLTAAINRRSGGVDSRYHNGYLAQFYNIDGAVVAPTEFAETKDGVWIPKAYSGSYGNNGWLLEFKQTGTGTGAANTVGADTSGNDNHWTSSGLAASDVVLDSPTNNFATFNPLDISGTTLTYSEGNLKAERTSSSFAQAYSSFSFDSGKWYAEILPDTGNHGIGVIAGTTNPGANRYMGQDSYTYGYYSNGQKVNSATYTNYGDTWTGAADGSGDVIGIYIDADNGDIYFSKNGTVQNSGTAAFTGVTGPFRFAIASESNAFHIANFGQDDSFAGLKTSGSAAASDDNGNGVFYDTIGLSGYLALCSANLPEATIGPNIDANETGTTSDEHFNTVLYTGNGSTQSITGVGFQPDWTWLKSRSNAQGHNVFDVIRGANVALFPNDTNAEFTDTDRLTSFDSDGFSLGADANVNTNSATYVAWNWKAGGTAVSNTDGSITSSVSANQDAGFSIVSYTGVNTASGQTSTIGHGLASAPELIICKRRNASGYGWSVGSTAIGNFITSSVFELNQTGAPSITYAYEWGANPTSTVFTTGYSSRTNINGGTFIAYCFHSVEGFSKVGSYVGNGSADGTFVAVGFKPAFVLTKRTDSTSNWVIWDATRNEYNVTNNYLLPNSTDAEVAGSGGSIGIDILSNGFKFRSNATAWNASGGSYLYLCFAEAPFKYANAR